MTLLDETPAENLGQIQYLFENCLVELNALLNGVMNYSDEI